MLDDVRLTTEKDEMTKRLKPKKNMGKRTVVANGAEDC